MYVIESMWFGFRHESREYQRIVALAEKESGGERIQVGFDRVLRTGNRQADLRSG
jgi:hypothetical protein